MRVVGWPVAMGVAHGIRSYTFAGTAPPKYIKIIISRAASIKNKRARCITALVRTQWLQLTGDDIVAEGEPEELDRLDEVSKRLVVVEVLDRIRPGGEVHGQYLKRHV